MTMHVTVRRDRQGLFQACCPSLPGCQARAATEQEAIRRVRLAIFGYVASLNGVAQHDLRIRAVLET